MSSKPTERQIKRQIREIENRRQRKAVAEKAKARKQEKAALKAGRDYNDKMFLAEEGDYDE